MIKGFLMQDSRVTDRSRSTSDHTDLICDNKSFISEQNRTEHKNINKQCCNNTSETTIKLQSVPGLIKELNREADDLVICDYSLVLVGHLSAILIGSIRS